MPPTPTGTISLVTAAPQCGQLIQFACVVDGLKGKQHARIYLKATQQDEVEGEVVVYGEAFPARIVDDEFAGSPAEHNGESGIVIAAGFDGWPNVPPGDPHAPATCTAKLFYFDQHDTEIVLAVTPAFEAAGI
jgi:hypothetical protein